MVRKTLFLFIGIFLISLSFISAWDFYGYVYDVNGTALYNATVNITIWTMAGGPPTLVGSNASYSNETGGFNFPVYDENSSYFYKPIIRHFEQNKTDGTTAIDYIGQSLPWFPFGVFNGTTDINFYLREAGTINITILNRTEGRDYFYYQIKDTKLGYPIAEEWSTMTDEAIVYLPRDRNYSIMVYPNESMSVSFNWDNFSANSSYDIGSLSNYNATTHTLHKQFNCTDDGVMVSGYALNSTGGTGGYDEFTVVPYLLETQNMVYLGQTFPYNMSFGLGHNSSDSYNLATGFYNISLPGANETSNILLFATARNGTNYYGGFRNLTLNYGDSDRPINFTMYPLMPTAGWASVNSNITMDDFGTSGQINISTAKQAFNLVNASNTSQILPNVDAHIEITVDYSDYNCTEFTFMTDLSNENGIFYVPLINATGVKEINVYTTTSAPKRVATMTAAEIIANNNITMAPWSPEDLEGDLDEENIFIELYKSNSDCDVPNPGGGCQIGGFGPPSTHDQVRANFNPLSAIIGGGKLSFRMGYGGIKIHYVNVDMLASGPPDVAFDSDYAGAESKPSGGAFSSALRFGSMGPTIYDYVLVSIPYTQGSTSVAGLDESQDVNMSLPLFYTGDDVDILIWNTATNGTSGTLLAGNDSHYSAHSSEWETLMGNNTCVTNVNLFNATNPCYIDTTNDRIWIRIPHFDGNEPSISGSSTTVSADGDTPGGGGTAPYWTMTYVVDDEQFEEGYTKELAVKNRMKVKVGINYHYIGVVNLTETTVLINVSSDIMQVKLSVGNEARFDVVDDGFYDIYILLNDIANNKANLTVQKIHEEIPEDQGKVTTTGEITDGEIEEEGLIEKLKADLTWLWIIIGVIVLAAIIGGGIAAKKRKS